MSAGTWSEERDASGKTYFLDHSTKTTHWTLPPAVRATLPLAAGWREEKTAEGQTFYLNDGLKATQWDRPVTFDKTAGIGGIGAAAPAGKTIKKVEEDLSEYGFGHGGSLVEHHHAGGNAMVASMATLPSHPSQPSQTHEYAGFDEDNRESDEDGLGFGETDFEAEQTGPGGPGQYLDVTTAPSNPAKRATKRPGPRPVARPHLPQLKLATENYSDSWMNRKISEGFLQVDVSGSGIKGPSFDYPVICNGIPNTTGRSEIRAKVDGSNWCILGVATQDASLNTIFQTNKGCFGLAIGGVGGRQILCGGARSVRKWGPDKFAVPCFVHLTVDHDEGTLAVSIDDTVGMDDDGEGTVICEGLPIGTPLSFCSASYGYDVDIKLVGPKGKPLSRIPKNSGPQASQVAFGFGIIDRDGDGHISAGELKSAHNDPANMAFVGDGGSSPWGGSAGADAVASASSGGGGTTYTADEGRVTTNPLARSDSISDDVRSTQYAMRSGSDDAPTDSAASMFNI